MVPIAVRVTPATRKLLLDAAAKWTGGNTQVLLRAMIRDGLERLARSGAKVANQPTKEE